MYTRMGSEALQVLIVVIARNYLLFDVPKQPSRALRTFLYAICCHAANVTRPCYAPANQARTKIVRGRCTQPKSHAMEASLTMMCCVRAASSLGQARLEAASSSVASELFLNIPRTRKTVKEKVSQM